MSYGNQWWTGEVAWHGRVLPWAAALGNGSQRIFVVPGLDLRCVTRAAVSSRLVMGPFRRGMVRSVSTQRISGSVLALLEIISHGPSTFWADPVGEVGLGVAGNIVLHGIPLSTFITDLFT